MMTLSLGCHLSTGRALHKKVSPSLSIPFSNAIELMDALFWDRRRPRLLTLPLEDPQWNDGRRGRLRSQKSAPISPLASLKGIEVPDKKLFY